MVKKTTRGPRPMAEERTPLNQPIEPHKAILESTPESDKIDEAMNGAALEGYKAGMMRAHRFLLEAAKGCKANNSSLTYYGVERLAWEVHNLAKDPRL